MQSEALLRPGWLLVIPVMLLVASALFARWVFLKRSRTMPPHQPPLRQKFRQKRALSHTLGVILVVAIVLLGISGLLVGKIVIGNRVLSVLFVIILATFAALRYGLKRQGQGVPPRSCPSCGNDLPANAPHGICPRCLLKQAIDSPVPVAAPRFSPPTSPYGAPFVAPAPEELAPFFPQLEILELLGQGGMGAVYKARQAKLGRLVALKILPSEAGRDPAFAERFNREARALAHLNHPNVVAVHDFGEAGDLFYFIMEFVDGLNLREELQRGQLQQADAVRIIPQICDALQYAHDEGIVHRDIKPENILLDKRGRVKIADFGLAKLLSSGTPSYTLTGSRQIMGTPHYMAPEQMEKPSTVDHRADIYSLGVVFYEMLTGELPLGRFSLPSEKAAVDGRLDEIVLRTLEKDAARRYQRVSEVKADMEAMAGALPSPISPAVPIRSFQDEVDLEMRRLQIMGPALGMIVVAILGVVFWTILALVIIVDEWDRMAHSSRHAREFLLIVGILGPLVLIAASMTFFGARRMMRFERYEFAVFAAILTMVPWSGPVALIGIPIGIWALRILSRPEVKMAFIRNKVQTRLSGAPRRPSFGPRGGKLQSIFGAVGSLFFGSRVQMEQPAPTIGQASYRGLAPLSDANPSPASEPVARIAGPATTPAAQKGIHPGCWLAIAIFVTVFLAFVVLVVLWFSATPGVSPVLEELSKP